MLLKTSFPYKEISEGCNFLSGFAFKSEEFSEIGIPVVKIKNIQNMKVDFTDSQCFPESLYHFKLDKFKVHHKDILIAMTGQGSVGRVGQLRIDESKFGLLNQRVGRFICDEHKLNRDYLFYILTTDRYQEHLFDKAVGSGQPNLSPSDITSVEIPFPIYEEQIAIASILSAIDDKIENNLQMNKTLEVMAMTLYKHWFVDFGPFREGEFVDSELGRIPKGWEVKPIGDLIETVGGGTPKTEINEYWENGTINWYSPTDLTKANSLYSLGSAKKITELGLQKSSSRLFPKGSLLMSSRATIGAITINRKEACTNQGFITMIPNKTLSIFQLHGWTVQNMDLIISKSNGSTFKEISKTNFRNLLIVVGNGIQNYLEKSEAIYNQVENNILENQTLTTLRNTLLPKLISGEVRVKDFAQT